MEISVAIVDDDNSVVDTLKSYLKKFSAEQGGNVTFQITEYNEGMDFITSYRANFDIVLMDIDMPKLDGMKTAEKLRAVDSFVVIIFVTNLSQFAVKGYEVGAQDFLVKPVSYANFALKIHRAVERLKLSKNEKIQIGEENGVHVVPSRSIKYVEIMGHSLIYHTAFGDIKSYGSLKKTEQILGKGFVRCNNCYLVNLAYVQEVRDFVAVVDGKELVISRPRKKEFLKMLADYYGGRI